MLLYICIYIKLICYYVAILMVTYGTCREEGSFSPQPSWSSIGATSGEDWKVLPMRWFHASRTRDLWDFVVDVSWGKWYNSKSFEFRRLVTWIGLQYLRVYIIYVYMYIYLHVYIYIYVSICIYIIHIFMYIPTLLFYYATWWDITFLETSTIQETKPKWLIEAGGWWAWAKSAAGGVRSSW